MNIETLHQLYLTSNGISTDTRSIGNKQLFFALSGDNFNGNLYANQAYEKGAINCVVDDPNLKDSNFIWVENTLNTLQELARFHRNFLNIPILALTGSNGKTTTKELINAVLSKKFKTTATKGNLNNHIGVPLTILSMDKNTEFGIVEMGANHMQEIALLSSIAQPNYGLITNIGKAHLEGFGSEKNILIGKTELYDFLESKENSTCFVNTADDRLVNRSKQLKCVYFGLNNDTRHLTEIQLLSDNPHIKLEHKNQTIESNLMGSYNAENIAAAITIGTYFNVETTAIKQAISNYQSTNNRSQLLNTTSNTIVLDAYNANPTSMLLSIQSFEKTASNLEKMVILGDMFELGDASLSEHTTIVNYLLNSKNIQRSLLIGKHFSECTNTSSMMTFETTEEASIFLKENKIKNQEILIKGSRGMRLENLLEYL